MLRHSRKGLDIDRFIKNFTTETIYIIFRLLVEHHLNQVKTLVIISTFVRVH